VTLVLLFGAALLLRMVVSGSVAGRALSTSLIFLVVGAFAARLEWVSLHADSSVVDAFVDVGLFIVLFVEGLALHGSGRGRWALVGRGVALGLLIAVVGVALPTHFLAGFGWLEALLISIALAASGPMIAPLARSADETAASWFGLQRAESALIAGLAVSLLVISISGAGGQDLLTGVLPLAGGLALGAGLPALTHLVLQLPSTPDHAWRQPRAVLVVAVLLYGLAHVTGVSPYVAAFAAGAMVSWLNPIAAMLVGNLSDQLAHLTGAAAMLMFGVLLTPATIRGTPGMAWLAVVVFVALVRPAATAVPLLGAAPRRAVLAAGWLAPRPFTSVLLALLILRSGIVGAAGLYGFIAVCIVVMVLVHSATDVTVSRFRGAEPRE
jgi:sodium/hydrogen antiporter